MAQEIKQVEPVAGPGIQARVNCVLEYLAREDRARAFAVAAFVFGACLMLLYSPFSQMEQGDSAGYDYIAQSILRGQMPYRDVIDMKAPASMYLSAFAMAAGNLFGVRDIIAVRLFQAMLVGLLSSVTFLAARIYLKNPMAALIAFSIPLLSHRFAEWMVAGTQPKLPMVLFGMAVMLFIATDRPLLAGVFSMLSCLSWQPGLMFAGAAVLIFSRYLTTWRDGRALKVLIGVALPLVVVCLYFYSRGALPDLWNWTIAYNYGVFRPETQRDALEALNHIWRVLRRVFTFEIAFVALSLAGFVMYAVERVRAKLKKEDRAESFRDAILIPPAIYFVFCIINMQSGPDLLPFIPFIGIFTGLFFVRLGRFIANKTAKRAGASPLRFCRLIPGAALGLILIAALAQGLVYRTVPGFTLQDQDRLFSAVAKELTPEDKLYVHGTAELLVLLNRPNLNPYVFLNQGIDKFVAAERGGDFNQVIAEMEAARPKIVALSRLRTVSSRALLEQWVANHYDQLLWLAYNDSGLYIRREP